MRARSISLIATTAMLVYVTPMNAAIAAAISPDPPVRNAMVAHASVGTWISPLQAQLPTAQREAEMRFRKAHGSPRQLHRSARWMTDAAIFALSAVGVIQGHGRDNTGDIGKPPLQTSQLLDHPAIQGGIR